MIVSIHQPNFLPWLGYFDKIVRADKFVFLDHVVVNKVNYVNRVQIFFGKDEVNWFTVPIQRKSFQKLNEVQINYQIDWVNKHLKTLQLVYSKTPYFKEIFTLLADVFQKKHEFLVQHNVDFIFTVLHYLGLGEMTKKCSFSSDLNLHSTSTQALIDITKQLNGDSYMCGGGAEGYQDEAPFGEQGIELMNQNFSHPAYTQLHSSTFTPGLSIVDLLFNYGKNAKNILISH